MNWYKVHHGMPSDAVWAVVAKRSGVPRHAVVAVWCALLDHASQNDPRGSIARLDAELIAVSLDLETEQVSAIVSALRERGKIDGETLANWEKRQKATSTERVRRYRERKSVSGNAGETENETPQPLQGNDETIDKRREEQKRTDSDSSLRSESGADAPSPPDLIEADPFAIPLNLRRLEPHGDWRKMLFDHGLAFLQNRLGGKPGAHRPLIGKWLAMAGDDAKAVYDALADCEAEGKADPKSWMIARLGGRRPDRSVAAAFEAQRA